jgi:hypothetical protein
MNQISFAGFVLIALLVLVPATSAYAKEKSPPKAEASAAAAARSSPALEPKSIDVLKAMSARLAAAKSMSFTATSTYESPSRLGPPLVYATVAEVTLRRPDKLRVLTLGDGPPSEFYYDGKQMMAYQPGENLVAVADAPASVDAMLNAAYKLAAIYFPFSDVIVADPYGDIAPDLRQAFYIGQSRALGGTTTDMLAIVTDHLFAQIWIGADDKLPRAVRAIYLDDPSRLRQEVDFSNWKLDGEFADDAFSSAKAAGAQPIDFARPDPQLPPGLKPPPVKGAPPVVQRAAKNASKEGAAP